jgi:endonuclease YncB( thermonuclease family)
VSHNKPYRHCFIDRLVRLIVPRDNVTLTFVLAGIRAPKTARNESEKSDPYGPEAAEFASHRYMQRDVEVEMESVDKSGGFIGALYINKTENVAITLVREGLASIHTYSAESLSWAKALEEAEADAKKERKNVSTSPSFGDGSLTCSRFGSTTPKKLLWKSLKRVCRVRSNSSM